MQINQERLAAFFTELCEIESLSKKEKAVSQKIRNHFEALGVDSITIDDSAEKTQSETGNLIIRFDGNKDIGAPLFLACHMDTVGPVEGIKVVRNGDIFSSAGNTVLGADDKSGIASLIELITILKENNIPHCPIELVFTTCEEIGLLGAKAFDTSRLKAEYGYALDSTLREKVIIGAPAANRLKVIIQGKAAHSGSAPEAGINALAIAADAITQITLGRLDKLSTANFGLINGGTATNIIPEYITLRGEVRSHSAELLRNHTRRISDIFTSVAEGWPCDDNDLKPSATIEVEEDFPTMSLDESEPVVERIRSAASKINRPLSFDIAGGGSDANIFSGKGLKTAILPTGMAKVHTTEEQIDLKDMVALTELLLAMIS